ncbi:hypothetical protein [Streptomyces albicerus]|uniref:hypothetical protein n=1 Tax=Streptomyces albicerus TaxID=2569859 RepID=UPI00124B30F5|nr:hypothetical protein [Streptomyces albicerus]
MARIWAALVALCLALVGFLATATPARGDTATLNAFFASYHADTGSSVPLGDGRVLWLFGDTLTPAGTFRRNSAVVQGTDGVMRPRSGTFAKASAAGHWYWPGQAVREGTRLRVLAMDFTCTDPCGAWDMRYERTDVLTYRLPDLAYLGKASLPRRASGAMWSQLHKARDGYTYAYGSYSVAGQLGKAVEVARVPSGYVWCVTCWRYLSTRMGTGMELGTVVSVVRKAAGGYRLYSKWLDLWSTEIIAYDSATAYGPWGSRRTVATTPQSDGKWTYAVEAHAEQHAGTGRLALTYATNCDQLCADYHLTAITVAAP